MKSLVYCMLLNLLSLYAFGQKLPNKQENSIYAPPQVKIDGDISEWGTLQAYNHATDISYTMANDANYLYLVICAEDQSVVNKIIRGGVTLAIPKNLKQDKNQFSITYPVFEKGDRPALTIINKKMLESQNGKAEELSQDVVNQNNSSFAKKSKLIMVTGFQGLDTLLSVYNEDGIRVASRFDSHSAYTCEIAVSLKRLGLTSGDMQKFNYHIVLNGESPFAQPGKPTAAAGNEIVEAKIAAEQLQQGRNTAPTDFWNKYTILHK